MDIQVAMKQTWHFKRFFFLKKVAMFDTDQNDPYMHPFVNIFVAGAPLW